MSKFNDAAYGCLIERVSLVIETGDREAGRVLLERLDTSISYAESKHYFQVAKRLTNQATRLAIWLDSE